MKKIIVSTALPFASAAMVDAQITWGVKAGYDGSTIPESTNGTSGQSQTGWEKEFHAGGQDVLSLSDQFALRIGLCYRF